MQRDLKCSGDGYFSSYDYTIYDIQIVFQDDEEDSTEEESFQNYDAPSMGNNIH